MARTPEGRVKAEIRAFLASMGVWFAGQVPPAVANGWVYMPVPAPFGVHGIPDFCGILFGKPFYIEAKAPNGRPSENQLDRQSEILAAGGYALIVDNVEDVRAFVAQTWPKEYAHIQEAQKDRDSQPKPGKNNVRNSNRKGV